MQEHIPPLQGSDQLSHSLSMGYTHRWEKTPFQGLIRRKNTGHQTLTGHNIQEQGKPL
ncbi:hypothetical protein [Cyclobacterium xiamenense]|uniref:hypothetical protein n=1 Tax=Cyclobacterium xiamenense TaxID=1297121 RepID=UPI0012BA0B95|nr:hypothetical protein [Cyclobacterium xiamenense]